MSARTYENSRDLILESALQVLAKEGARRLTTDAVIKRSGLSKAGFFYNFKSKQALIVALCEKLYEEWRVSIEKHEAKDPNPINRNLRAQLSAMEEDLRDTSARSALIAKAMQEMFVMEPEFFKGFDLAEKIVVPRDKTGFISDTQSLLVTFALDSLWQNSRSGHFKLSAAEQQKLFQLLRKLTSERMEFVKPIQKPKKQSKK